MSPFNIHFIIFPLPLYTVPSQVTNVTVSKALSLDEVALRVTWNIPQSDITVSQYQVQYRRSGTTSWRSQDPVSSGATTSTLLEELHVGTTYQVRIRAVSAIGNGAWSSVESETTYMSELSSEVMKISVCWRW